MGMLGDLFRYHVENKRAERAQDLLLGKEQNLLGPGATETGRFGGLLNANATPEQYMTAGASLMGIPGYEGIGQQMMGGSFQNQNISAIDQARMDQQAEQFNRQMTEMNPYQQGMLDISKANNWATQQRQAMQDQRQAIQDQLGLGKYFTDRVTKQNAQMRSTVEGVQRVNASLPTVGNTGAIDWGAVKQNGAMQHNIVMQFAKTILPAEAVMSDDRGNIVLATNDAPDFLKGIVNTFNQGQLGQDGLQKLWAQMNQQAAGQYSQMQRNRQQVEGLGFGDLLMPDVGYQRPAAQIEPQAAVPAAALPDTIEWTSEPSRRYRGRMGR